MSSVADITTDPLVALDDLELPKSNLARISKNALPDGTVVAKDARLAISRSATVFINYLTAMYPCISNSLNINIQRSAEVSSGSGKKTLSGEDVFKALEQLDLEAFTERLRTVYEAHKISQTEKRRKSKASSTVGDSSVVANKDDSDNEHELEEAAHNNKRTGNDDDDSIHGDEDESAKRARTE